MPWRFMPMRGADRSSRLAVLARVAVAVIGAAPAGAQSAWPSPPLPSSGTVPRDTVREQALLRQTRVANGFETAVFAGPPVAQYPTCLASAPDGALFVCVDPNLSLSQAKGVGRIVRLVDSDGDGHADRYTVFAKMDSPRGVFFDGRTLYVMHPPTLTAYRDTDGDGIADESDDLVKGLGFDLDFRGADHSTNQITMGIDGWLYVAVGDYGYQHAVGKDGTVIRHRGGSVVRVRPDGTGLEIYAVGTRNIYDLALDPMLHVFTRDNTNDGDGWDTRLHYIPALAHMGYPMYYKYFADEHMPSLHDYGAGAGTGAVWVHDPGFPAPYDDALYTGDWTLNRVFHHRLTPKGASFDITQDEFVAIPHPADMVTDGRSHMYVASLVGGTFTFAGDTVGAVVRVSRIGAQPAPVAAPDALDESELLDRLVGPYSERRLQAQRELLRRARSGGVFAWWRHRTLSRRLAGMMLDTGLPPYARVAAMFTLTQLDGSAARDVVIRALDDPSMRALALRALADDPRDATGIPVARVVSALTDADPRVQLQALEALVRLHARDAAAAIVPLTASADPAVAHVAVNALVALDAQGASLAAVDTGAPALRRGALRALRQMHEPSVVRGLIDRVSATRDAATRTDLLVALARLFNREADWNGDWWTTRPSFLGPYFAPVQWEESPIIRPVLRRALLAADGPSLDTLARELMRNRVLPQGAAALIVATGTDPLRESMIDALLGKLHLEAPAIALLPTLDARNAATHAAVAELLAAQTSVGEQLLPLVRRGALDSTVDAEIRGRLLGAVSQMADSSARAAATDLFVRVTPGKDSPAPVEAAWRRYVGDRRRVPEIDQWLRLARQGDPAQRTLAFSVLVQALRSTRTPAAVRERVQPALDSAWADPSASPSLAQAVRLMRAESLYASQLAHLEQVAHAPNVARTIGVAPKSVAQPTPAAQPTRATRAQGQRVYAATCAACHQANGQGLPEKYPPLAGSEWVGGDERRLLRIVLHGLIGEVDVAGDTYTGAMPGWGATLSDADVAAVTSYLRSTFGNRAAPISPETVARVRREHSGRTTPWTVRELQRAR